MDEDEDPPGLQGEGLWWHLLLRALGLLLVLRAMEDETFAVDPDGNAPNTGQDRAVQLPGVDDRAGAARDPTDRVTIPKE